MIYMLRYIVPKLVSVLLFLIALVAFIAGAWTTAAGIGAFSYLVSIDADVADIRRRLKRFEPPESDDL